jgi:hypothetical protein
MIQKGSLEPFYALFYKRAKKSQKTGGEQTSRFFALGGTDKAVKLLGRLVRCGSKYVKKTNVL